ncbi:MAG: helix-turn-helix domain-containing protein [Alphaproteobacteria bacterium]
MTPFGQNLRNLRTKHNTSQKELAKVLGVSPAYLSALERGNRGIPSVEILERICRHFNIIWEEAENLQKSALLSDPKISINTSNLDNPSATKLANILAKKIHTLSPEQINKILDIIND